MDLIKVINYYFCFFIRNFFKKRHSKATILTRTIKIAIIPTILTLITLTLILILILSFFFRNEIYFIRICILQTKGLFRLHIHSKVNQFKVTNHIILRTDKEY